MKKFNELTNDEVINMTESDFEKMFKNEFGDKLIDEENEKKEIDEILAPKTDLINKILINKIFK